MKEVLGRPKGRGAEASHSKTAGTPGLIICFPSSPARNNPATDFTQPKTLEVLHSSFHRTDPIHDSAPLVPTQRAKA